MACEPRLELRGMLCRSCKLRYRLLIDITYLLPQRLKSLRAKEFEATNKSDYQIVMDAAHIGDSDSVEVLHEVKADLGICDQKGTAMHRAVRGHQPKILTVLGSSKV